MGIGSVCLCVDSMSHGHATGLHIVYVVWEGGLVLGKGSGQGEHHEVTFIRSLAQLGQLGQSVLVGSGGGRPHEGVFV